MALATHGGRHGAHAPPPPSRVRRVLQGCRLAVETLWTAGASLRLIYAEGADAGVRAEDRRRTLRHFGVFAAFVCAVVWRETAGFQRWWAGSSAIAPPPSTVAAAATAP